MSPTLLFALTIDALIISATVFAWWKGGPAERWGSAVNLLSGLGSVVASMVLHGGARDVTLLFCDGFLAFGLLFLGVRYANLWIGAAMLLQAIQFLLHTYYFVMELRHDRLFVVVNNLVSLGIVICIVAGSYLSWRRRAAPAAA